MNYSNFIVKVLKKPKQRFLKKNILLTELHVQFPSTRNKNKNNLNKMDLLIWGSLGEDIIKYYKINDYILVEGFISFHKKKVNNNQGIKISVSKMFVQCGAIIRCEHIIIVVLFKQQRDCYIINKKIINNIFSYIV